MNEGTDIMNELLCIFKDKNKWKIFLDNECVMNYCTCARRKLKNLQWYINSLNVYNFQIKYCVWYLQYIYCVVLLVHIKHIPRIYLLGVGSWQNWWWETTTAGNKLAWEFPQEISPVWDKGRENMSNTISFSNHVGA